LIQKIAKGYNTASLNCICKNYVPALFKKGKFSSHQNTTLGKMPLPLKQN